MVFRGREVVSERVRVERELFNHSIRSIEFPLPLSGPEARCASCCGTVPFLFYFYVPLSQSLSQSLDNLRPTTSNYSISLGLSCLSLSLLFNRSLSFFPCAFNFFTLFFLLSSLFDHLRPCERLIPIASCLHTSVPLFSFASRYFLLSPSLTFLLHTLFRPAFPSPPFPS